MIGGPVAVVGPSGVGKDTLMAAVAEQRPDVVLARRTITRPAELGGEPFEGVTRQEFEKRLSEGGVALHWQAHGLSYGIALSQFCPLAKGAVVLFNGSRAALPQAADRFPDLRIIHVTARPEVLAERLADRGRETPSEIAARLARRTPDLPAGVPVTEVDNSGSLQDGVRAFLAALRPEQVSQ